jgi:hypothetical protein
MKMVQKERGRDHELSKLDAGSSCHLALVFCDNTLYMQGLKVDTTRKFVRPVLMLLQ